MASLDAEELLHLGLHASRRDDPGKAIDYLKECLALQPENADATYLLGALYAQIGFYDRAKDTLSRAVDLNGGRNALAHSTAIFQLGLLHLSSGAADLADNAWQGLDALPDDHWLNLFRRGLLALAQDDFSNCIELLQRGIDANTFNDALNDDMQRLKTSVQAAAQRTQQLEQPQSELQIAARGAHLLGNYRQRNRH